MGSFLSKLNVGISEPPSYGVKELIRHALCLLQSTLSDLSSYQTRLYVYVFATILPQVNSTNTGRMITHKYVPFSKYIHNFLGRILTICN